MDLRQLTSTFMAMRQRLLAIARQLLGNDDDAVDALQDAFVGLWTRSDSLSDERHARGATVISVRNASIDLLRRRAVRRGDEAGVIPEPADDTADCYGESHAERLFGEVSRLMDAHLSERDREILRLRDAGEWPMEEIAARFGLTEAHVRTIVSRARRTIRDRYLELQRIRTDNHKHNPQTL
ncbi:RNA polymerase sigma factor [Paramuribaculum intestinale]|uniref:RNA polymerase sigma factor n=1 Tax=Paramuribaculum intestinale TaxID=2094151 RepID=UPI0025A9AE73|nr:sigma-70 family RNA polymerase sigma factor [Paramuribaculum intestinale]